MIWYLMKLLKVVHQTQQQLGERLKQREEKEAEGERMQLSLHSRLSETEEALERERAKVKQLEGELVTHSVMKEEMDRTIEKVILTAGGCRPIHVCMADCLGERVLPATVQSYEVGLCNCSCTDWRLRS